METSGSQKRLCQSLKVGIDSTAKYQGFLKFNDRQDLIIQCHLANVQNRFNSFHLVKFCSNIQNDNKTMKRSSECNMKCYIAEQMFVTCEKSSATLSLKVHSADSLTESFFRAISAAFIADESFS